MAFFMQPPQNFVQGPGDLDALLRELSPTPELLDPQPDNLPESEKYKKDIVKVLNRLWDHEQSANADRWDKIGRAWEMVNNNYASPRNDPDLSDLRMPETLMTEKQVVGILFGMIEQSPDWWAPETKVPSKAPYINLLRDLVNDQLSNPRVGWWDIVEEGFDSLAITGHVETMVAVKYGQTPQFGQGGLKGDDLEPDEGSSSVFSAFQPAPENSTKPFIPNDKLPLLHFRNIPTEFCVKDSSNEGLYKIWTLDLPVGLIFSSAERMGFDKAALRRAREASGVLASESSSLVTMMRSLTPQALDRQTSKLIRLTFFEGDLIDLETGATLFEKRYMVMANNCEIVYGPAEIPWWDGQGTIVDAPFISVAHEVYGRGLISENADTFLMSANLTNQLLDYLNEALSGAYEYDQDRIRNEGQRTNLKIYPRACIPVEGDGARPAINRIQMGETSNSTWQVIQALDTRKQNTTGTGQMGGAPRGRGRITKGEFDARAADAGALWKLVFRNIQSKWLSPLLRLSCLRLLQAYPDDLWKKYVLQKKVQLLSNDVSLDPQKKAAWDKAYDECANWGAEKRFGELGSDFDFSVKVFSALMDRQGRIEKSSFLIRNLSTVPGALQSINMRELVRQMVVDLGYDTEKILLKADQMPPSTDVPSATQTGPGVEDEDIPDITSGAGGLPTLQGGSPMSGAAFPGPPNAVSPPPGM